MVKLLLFSCIGFGFIFSPVRGQSNRLPYEATTTLRSKTRSAKETEYTRKFFAINVKDNGISIGDTLVIRLEPLNVDELGIIVKLCHGNCRVGIQPDGTAVTSGTEVKFISTDSLRATNYTLKFPIEPETQYTKEDRTIEYLDNADLNEIYVYTTNANRAEAQYRISASLIKRPEAKRDFPYPAESAKPDLSEARYHALLIAVNDYDNPTLRLKRPAVDINRLDSVLSAKYAFSTITQLINPTKKELIRALNSLSYKLVNEDNLLIFFAGHATYQRPNGYWALRDSGPNLDSYLSTPALVALLSQIPTQHQLLIADACYGTALVSSRDLTDNKLKTWSDLYSQKSRRAISSSYLEETPDNSVFMDYLVKRLNQNDELYLSGEELFNSLKYAVHNRTSKHQQPQYGNIKGLPQRAGDFLFRKKTALSDTVIRLVRNSKLDPTRTDSLDSFAGRMVNIDGDSAAYDSTRFFTLEAGPVMINTKPYNAKLRYSKDGVTWADIEIPGNDSRTLNTKNREVYIELPNESAYPTKRTVERGKRYRINWSTSNKPSDLIGVK
ncbi:MAG: caspase family protein [Cytophagaceae bacterium]|nr:caspase family protein [Cytophagaceae bacterium]